MHNSNLRAKASVTFPLGRAGVGVAILSGFVFTYVCAMPIPVAAQSDPQARALINQLLPRTSANVTRGIRLPAASPSGEARPPSGQANAPSIPSTPGSDVAPVPNVTAAAAPPVRPTRPSTTAPPDLGAASITVSFPSGSATLTSQAEAALAPLGRALSHPDLAAFRFRIEGHTDTVGPRAMNQALSERRAAAVQSFLLSQFGIDPLRLEIVGRGEDDLLIATADETSEERNRRVQVINLGS